jgi:hypothetical protein
MACSAHSRRLASGRGPKPNGLLIDEFHVELFPYAAREGTRLFDDDPKSYQLELVSSTAWSNGTVGLHYRQHR